MQPATVIGAVVTEGGTAFDSAQLLDTYIDLIGRPATDDNLAKIKNRIVALYGENNFYLPQVEAKPSSDVNNVFIFIIHEPVLNSFVVNGGNDSRRKAAENFLTSLRGSPIYASFLFKELEQAMSLHIQSDVSISPKHLAGTAGDFHLEVVVSGRSELEMTISNEGSDRLGREVFAAEWRLLDKIPGIQGFYLNTFNTLTTDGFRSLGSGLILDAGRNHSLLVDASVSRARLEVSGEPEIVFDKLNYSLGWQTIFSEQMHTGNGFSLTLLARDFEQAQTSVDLDEKLRLVDAGYWSYHAFTNSIISWTLSARQGLDAMGAELSGPLVDPETDIDFTRFNASLVSQFQFPQRWALRIDTLAQYSSDNLPFSQRFAIASNATARAYESGELNGDSGAGIKFEIRQERDVSNWQAEWVPYFYYGIGRVTDNLLDDSFTGASVGIGSRLLGNSWSAYLEVGKPLIEESIYRTSTPRTQAGLSFRF